MARAATTLLFILAMFNVVHGDLLRPCVCAAETGSPCGFCPAQTNAADGSSTDGSSTDNKTPC